MYICIDRQCCRVNVWLYISERNDLVMIILLCLTVIFLLLEQNDFIMTLAIFICFVLTSIWKWHALIVYSIYGIEETTSAEKTSIIKKLLKINNWVVKNIFIVCLLLLGGWPSRESLLHAFNNLHLCLTFNLCLVYHLLCTPYECYVG